MAMLVLEDFGYLNAGVFSMAMLDLEDFGYLNAGVFNMPLCCQSLMFTASKVLILPMVDVLQ